MKIFNWVHHRFHKKSVANDQDPKKPENDKVSLLENEALADGWKEGILAIGTMGIDLSKTFQQDKDVNQILLFGHGDDEEYLQEGEIMEIPLVLKASKHGFHKVQKQDPSPCDHKVAKPDNVKEEEVVVVTKHSKDLEIECTDEKISKTTGERTTLADLLSWGDSEKNKSNHKICNRFDIVSRHVSSTGIDNIKSTLISKKKKVERDDSTNHPIKKTKRFMKKMLKKKIHPDIMSQKKETDAGIIDLAT
ncbi:hypothetical protein LXL04_010823 [Taraxacum kok-saghyz]